MGSTHWCLVARIILCSPARSPERSSVKSCSSIRRKIVHARWKKRWIDNRFGRRRQIAVSYTWLSPTQPIIFSTSPATRCSCISARSNCNLCPRFWQTPCHETVGVVDHFSQLAIGNATLNLNTVPVSLVHVVTRRDLLV